MQITKIDPLELESLKRQFPQEIQSYYGIIPQKNTRPRQFHRRILSNLQTPVSVVYKLFQSTEKEGKVPNFFHAVLTLIPKLREKGQREKLQITISHNY